MIMGQEEEEEEDICNNVTLSASEAHFSCWLDNVAFAVADWWGIVYSLFAVIVGDSLRTAAASRTKKTGGWRLHSAMATGFSVQIGLYAVKFWLAINVLLSQRLR